MTSRWSWIEWTLLAGLILWTVARAQDPALDLPVSPESHQTAAAVRSSLLLGRTMPSPVGTAPVPPQDDPRDEPAPVFFGEEIDTAGGALVYVLDVSGSMGAWWRPAGAGPTQPGGTKWPTRLDAAKAEACRSIAGLSPGLRFNVVSYNCVMAQLWPEARPASAPNTRAACAWVQALNSSGGTGTGPGCAVALSDRSASALVLLTDGSPNCGAGSGFVGSMARHREIIRVANTQRAAVNVFGIAATGDMRRFCMDVAADSGGSYYDVPGP